MMRFGKAIAVWEVKCDHFGRVNFSGMAIIFCDDEIGKGDRFGRVNFLGMVIPF
jgi:hypothetical protein